jgi:fibronectin-binding autotransporter adhesin
VRPDENAGLANPSDEDGGGLFNLGGAVTLDAGSTVNDNTADRDGGGVFNQSGTVSLLNDSTVNDNTAVGNGGGVFNIGGTLDNCIAGVNVTGNTLDDIFVL